MTDNSPDQDEDFVGEETRPKPISSLDPHLKSLYGFLNDHNYCPAITENTEQILKKCYQKAVTGTTNNNVAQQPKPVNSSYSYIYKPTGMTDVKCDVEQLANNFINNLQKKMTMPIQLSVTVHELVISTLT